METPNGVTNAATTRKRRSQRVAGFPVTSDENGLRDFERFANRSTPEVSSAQRKSGR
jgi:hypothetical protein